MTTKIRFLRDHLLEKYFIIRCLFMLQSVNRDNDDFSYISRNNETRELTRVVLIQIKVSMIHIFKVIIISQLLQIFLTKIMSTNFLRVVHFVHLH